MNSKVTLTRPKWYGAVMGATALLFFTIWLEGLDRADFVAGALSAILFMPLLMRDD